MKTYGKFSRSNLPISLLRSDDKSSVEFSSDSDSDKEVAPPHDVRVNGKSVIDPMESMEMCSENSSVPTDLDNNSMLEKESLPGSQSTLSVFDFMSKTISPRVKRRKTRYTVQKSIENLYEPASGEIGDYMPAEGSKRLHDIIHNVNEFLDGLQPKGEDPLLHTFEEQVMQSRDEYSKKDESGNRKHICVSGKVYNKRRTLLIEQKEGEDMENAILEEYNEALEDEKREEEEELRNSLSPDERKLAQNKVYHYNELKNIGKTLGYQEDLEFLMSSISPSGGTDDLMSALLDFSSAIDTNESFKCYLMKSHSLDICEKCLTLVDSKNSALRLIQARILDTFLPQVGNNALDKLPNISTTLLSVSRDLTVAKTLKEGGKILRLNYEDFIQRSDSTPGAFYAFNIWCKCFNYFPVADKCKFFKSSLDVINSSAITRDIQERLLEFIELVLSDKECKLELQNESLNSLMESLTTVLQRNPNDEHLLKCLILLTNNPEYVRATDSHLLNSAIGILIRSVCTLYPMRPKLGLDADVLLLQLGLALNLLSEATIQTSECDNLWDMMCSTLSSGITAHDFVTLLLCLCFGYLSLNTLGKQKSSFASSGVNNNNNNNNATIIPLDLRQSMLETLEKFRQAFNSDGDNINNNFNPTISERVDYILNALGDCEVSGKLIESKDGPNS